MFSFFLLWPPCLKIGLSPPRSLAESTLSHLTIIPALQDSLRRPSIDQQNIKQRFQIRILLINHLETVSQRIYAYNLWLYHVVSSLSDLVTLLMNIIFSFTKLFVKYFLIFSTFPTCFEVGENFQKVNINDLLLKKVFFIHFPMQYAGCRTVDRKNW